MSSAAASAMRQGLQLLGGRAGFAAQQCSGFTSLTLGSWWSGTTTAAAAPAVALGWQRLSGAVPTLSDVRWMAAPKRKVTPHRRGNRNAMKGIRRVPVVAQCSQCQRVFPQHAMPSKCEEDDCPAFNVRANPQQAEPAQ